MSASRGPIVVVPALVPLRPLRRVTACLRSSLTTFLLVLPATSGVYSQTPSVAARISVLSGHVVNARTGAPMARVLVQANGHAAFTTAEGRFQISDTSPIAAVQFTKPGFALSPEQRDPGSVSVPSGATIVEAELWPEAVLAGTVTSPDGDPLARIAVTAVRSSFLDGAHSLQSSGFTFTDAHGGFRMPVPAGDYLLETRYAPPDATRSLAVLPSSAPSHAAPQATDYIHIASGEELHFDLRPQLAPAFHLILPIEGDQEQGRLDQRSPALTITSLSGGAFQPSRRSTPEGLALDLPAGVYQIAASLGGGANERAGRATISVPDHDSTGPALHLDPVPIIPVVETVDLAAASAASTQAPPIASLNLQLEPAPSDSAPIGQSGVRVVARGSAGPAFIVTPGSYQLQGGESSGWAVDSATFGSVDLLRNNLVVGASGSSEPIRLTVSRATGSVSGVTRIAGAPAACWVVFVGEPGTLPRFFVRRSEANGNFNAGALPLRRFRLLALPLLSVANFADPAVLDHLLTYVQTINVTASTSASLTLDAVPAHELYP